MPDYNLTLSLYNAANVFLWTHYIIIFKTAIYKIDNKVGTIEHGFPLYCVFIITDHQFALSIVHLHCPWNGWLITDYVNKTVCLTNPQHRPYY